MSNLGKSVVLRGELAQELKYGENAWQSPAGLYETDAQDDPLSITNFVLQFGAPLGYNNYADVDRLLQTVTHIAAVFDKNYGLVPVISAGAKHGNVCGVAVSDSSQESLRLMIEGDERAIFGGSVMTTAPVSNDEASLLMGHNITKGKRLLDVLVAPSIDHSAQPILERKAGRLKGLVNSHLNTLSVDSLDTSPRHRYVRGGFLLQDNYFYIPDFLGDEVVVHGQEANEQQSRDMLLAWAIGSTSNSNTITLVKNGQLLGNGVGQQDRVSAVELAIKRAEDSGHDIRGAVAYSDSFFPFPDGPKKLLAQGISAIFTTSGSVKDQEVFDVINEAGVILYTFSDSVGRGFYAH